MIVINADDWGRSRTETDAALDCFHEGTVTAVSAMVFMEDSERSAELARQHGVDVGLHLNLTEPFSLPRCDPALQASLSRVARFLKVGRYATAVFNPWLHRHFARLYEAQAAEFARLYGQPPARVDGHQHMHLAANLVWGNIIPCGVKVRRNFSFWPGEKSRLNRGYRCLIDSRLARHYRLTDYFFCLSQCLRSGRLPRVFGLGKVQAIELMCHPIVDQEWELLANKEVLDTFGK